jgi:hypothetical protein
MAESVELFNPKVALPEAFGLPPPDLHNKCSESGVWSDWYARLRVAVFAIFLLYYICIIPALCVIARRKSRGAVKLVGLVDYGGAVFSMFVFLVLAIIGDSLLNCNKIGDLKYLKSLLSPPPNLRLIIDSS